MTTPVAQLEAIRRYDLDTIMLPINPRVLADPTYAAAVDDLLSEATARDIGVMAIKAAAARPWGERRPTLSTWYEPYTEEADLQHGIDVALGTPGVAAFCTPGDLTLLPTVLAAAAAARLLSDDERAAVIERSASEALIFPIPA